MPRDILSILGTRLKNMLGILLSIRGTRLQSMLGIVFNITGTRLNSRIGAVLNITSTRLDNTLRIVFSIAGTRLGSKLRDVLSITSTRLELAPASTVYGTVFNNISTCPNNMQHCLSYYRRSLRQDTGLSFVSLAPAPTIS